VSPADRDPILDEAGRLLGAGVEVVADVTPPWAGSTRSRLVRAGGEGYVLQFGPRRSIARRARLTVALHDRAPWLPVPEVVAADTDPRGNLLSFLIMRAIPGVSGREALDGDDTAAGLGGAMGRLLPGIAAVPVAGLHLSSTWADAGRLTRAAAGWLARATPALGSREVRHLRESIDRLPECYAGARPVLAHGDFVPVNVILRGGRVVALLDLEHARLGHPLFDAARWLAVVGYHHPDRLPPASRAFLEAAGIGADGRTHADLATIGALQSLERVARSSTAGTFVRHVELLRSCMRGTPSVAFS